MKICLVIGSALLMAGITAATETGPGKGVFTGKCARCHKLYDPTRYDDQAWDSWMNKMRAKAKLNDEQYRQLTTYVQSLRVTTR